MPGSLTQEEILREQREVEAAIQHARHFGVLYERYYEQIFLFIFKRVGNREICADICSEVFLKAMLGLHSYKFRGVPFSAWLYRIAVNEANQYFRGSKNQRLISIDEGYLLELAVEMQEPRPASRLPDLLAAFQLLSEEEVQFVEFRYFERLPFREIAEVYGITENNAKVRMHRLLRKMKKLMEDKVTDSLPKDEQA